MDKKIILDMALEKTPPTADFHKNHLNLVGQYGDIPCYFPN